MGLTSAMYTGLTGLNVNQARIETIGHNIANVNTNAYRSSRTLFQTQFAQILSLGTAPSETSGGTNPLQIGHGAMVGTTQRTTNAGSLETTGLNTDLAVEGAGYFVLRSAAGREYYTRDGAFTLNAENELVSADGHYVQGFGVDSNYNITTGSLQNLTIPLGMQSIARATQDVVLGGDLSAAETRATSGSVTSTQALVDGIGGAATRDTILGDLRSAAAPGTALFADGDTITVSGLTRGGRTMPTQQFVIGTDGRTLGEFADWLERVAGIQDIDGLTGDPGVVVEGGALVIRSNAGEPNAIVIDSDTIRSSNGGSPLPFQMTPTAAATGTGVYTSFTVYDSLGNAVPVSATFVLEDTPDTGPVWRYFLESPAPGEPPQLLGTGTVTFDNDGNYVSAAGNEFTLDRSGSGAATPLTFTLNLSALNGLSTLTSDVIMTAQDGFPPGTLTGFGIGVDGTLTGVFSNGLTRTLGQVALATFTNEAGLIAEADNLFSVGPNSGPAAITAPGSLGTGQVRGGALEMSNVDLSREFIGLITSSTGFQAASRVISVSNEMLDQLLMVLR